ISRVVLALGDSKHLELVLVPAANDVQSESPLAHVRNGDHVLCGKNRMHQRRVHRSKNSDALGLSQQTASPGNCFQRAALKIRFAAIAFPSRNRQFQALSAKHPGWGVPLQTSPLESASFRLFSLQMFATELTPTNLPPLVFMDLRIAFLVIPLS